jgi:hypothetical protein
VFELGGAAEQQAAELRILGVRSGPQVGDAAAVVGDVAQSAIKARPALRLRLTLEGGADLLLAAEAELQRDAFGGAITKAAADVFTADDQVLAAVSAAAEEDMDVRAICVPVIDRHPVELGVEIFLDVAHQFAGECLQVADLGRILRRDDEPEVVPIVLAPFGEGALIGCLGRGIEHAGILAVAGHAFALEVGHVFRQRRRTEARPPMTHDARFRHDAPGVRSQPDRDRRAATTAEPGPAPALARSEAFADMPGLLRGPHHLADKCLRALGAAISVMDSPRPDMQVVVAPRHDPAPQGDPRRRRLDA